MPANRHSFLMLGTVGVFLLLNLLYSFITTILEFSNFNFVLYLTASKFFHILPIAFISSFLFNLLFFISDVKTLHFWKKFIVPILVITAFQIVNTFALEPFASSLFKRQLELKIISERVKRNIEKFEFELSTLRATPTATENESILRVYRENQNQRLKILRQLEGLYSYLNALLPNQPQIINRQEAVRLQREEIERNLMRLPFIETTRRLNWNDFSNLSSSSALVLAQELFNRKQWPESYQIATMAKLLGDDSPISDRLRQACRDEMLKIPVVDGNFFAQKKRAIELYQAGLYEESYYASVLLERNHFFDEELISYLNLARREMLKTTLFIEDAQISLEVPLYRDIFIVQSSQEIPNTMEYIFSEWISPSGLGYLFRNPVIIRRFSNGSWQVFQAEMARLAIDPLNPSKNILDFRFKHEHLNQTQKLSPGFNFTTLKLQKSFDQIINTSIIEFKPKNFDLTQLWQYSDDSIRLTRIQALSEIQLRFLSGPIFLMSVLILSLLVISYKKKKLYQFSDQLIAVLILIPGLLILFEVFEWAMRIFLAGLTNLFGVIPSLVIMGLGASAGIIISALLLAKQNTN